VDHGLDTKDAAALVVSARILFDGVSGDFDHGY